MDRKNSSHGVRKPSGSPFDDFAGEWAARMRSGGDSAHRFLERPAMEKELPDLKGKSVLCLGCGSGEECRRLKLRGAERVVGVDISEGLLQQARAHYKGIEFYKMRIEELDFKAGSFDFAYSSLVMHYLKEWGPAFRSIHRVLKRNGVLLFSADHPACWGASVTMRGGRKVKSLGYEKSKDGSYIIHGDYFSRRRIDRAWLNGRMPVSFFTRPISSMVNDLIRSGFEILEMDEPRPLKGAKSQDRRFYEVHSRIPLFIIFKARRV